ncbi:hypothetical protein ACFZBZ_00605 [Streptomyces sp. NPDC008196]|uniref:hypothetical protein n=1 Tax=Streptomyces sp. NPDC008196 TaxID=3364819 RepID=UPI0036EB62B6
MKDLQGIGAVAAAVVAAVGIASTILIGRWTLRGALRGAEETARAGLAQADASYRAALDAVKAQGRNDHLQWRRGVQRDAYAAFLQSVLTYTDSAHNDLGRASGQEETRACIAALRGLETDMSHRAWVVRLEGPDEVAGAAINLEMSAKVLVVVEQTHARKRAAMHEVGLRGRTHRQEVARIWELVPVAQGFWHTIGTPGMEDSSNEVLAELRALFSRCELPAGLIATLCQPHDDSPLSVDIPSFDEAIRGFIRAAREALHPEGTPTL